MNADTCIADTIAWLERAVIGLNLCPFAKAVHVKKQIRYVVSDAETTDGLRAALIEELTFLAQADADHVDTTLLIHPKALNDFLDYNDFLSDADDAIDALKLTGEIQIASFHPQYRFADTDADNITNFTNRSPYPMLHLLRETSIDRAVAAFPEASLIYEKNIDTMNQLGRAGWDKLWASGKPHDAEQ